MAQENDPISKGHDHVLENERIHYGWVLHSIQRFRLFFCGLVFAVLSFSLQVDFVSLPTLSRLAYSVAWIALLVSGVLALREAGDFTLKYTAKSFEGLADRWRKVMWGSFLIAMTFLGVAQWLA